MKTVLIVILALSAASAFAQVSESEEALILNQELQFLEDSAKNITTTSRPLGETQVAKKEIINDGSLERTYFGDEEKDSIRTRTAAPARRRGY